MLKHQAIANKLKSYIDDNQLSHGTKLPSLTELMEMYGVSKNTMMQLNLNKR